MERDSHTIDDGNLIKKKQKKYINSNYNKSGIKNNNYYKKNSKNREQQNKKYNSNDKIKIVNQEKSSINKNAYTKNKNNRNKKNKGSKNNRNYNGKNYNGKNYNNTISNSKRSISKQNDFIEIDKKETINKSNDNLLNKKIIKKSDEKDFIPRKKRKKKKLYVIFVLILLLCILIAIFGVSYFKEHQQRLKIKKIEEEKEILVNKISDHYNKYVKAKKDTILYKIDENNNYYEYGIVYADTEIILGDIEINHLTEFFYSVDLDCYIKFYDLEPIDELTVYNKRYKNYITFNKNIITTDEFSMYDDKTNNKIYTFKNSMNFPIIINDYDGKYFIEFNDRLVYVLKEDVKKIVVSNNTSLNNAKKITTLCYHRIYDSNHKCNDLYICKSKSNFEREMKYLSDNKFFTLTMDEMYLYLTKKIQVPRKSVVLTFDDGTLFELGIQILEKYNLDGTGFIKTGTFSDYSVYESPNFELQSHTDKMHVAGTCRRETSVQQGGGILCLPEETVLNDLKLSREKLDGAIALAYPFYDYNERAIKLVKKAGFKLAFIGANNVGGRAWPGINLYKVPRMTVWNTTSFDTFKGYVNN